MCNRNLLQQSGHERLTLHVHAGLGLVIVLGELLDSVGGEPCTLSLVEHVVGRVGPSVGVNPTVWHIEDNLIFCQK